MATAQDDRTIHAPADPNFGWQGPNISTLPDKLAEAHAADAARNLERATAPRVEVGAHIRRETAAMLHHDWAVPLALVERLLQLESEKFLLHAKIDALTRRVELLERKK